MRILMIRQTMGNSRSWVPRNARRKRLFVGKVQRSQRKTNRKEIVRAREEAGHPVVVWNLWNPLVVRLRSAMFAQMGAVLLYPESEEVAS